MSEPVDEYLRAELAALASAPPRPAAVGRTAPLAHAEFLRLFEAQVQSRQVDLTARWLQSVNAGYYTIGSSGHEGNAGVAAALRPDDPALLHYRSGAFYITRATQVPGADGVRDILLGLMAATADPISGGRHKVFGNLGLHVIPQTSTIGSHMPRAVGVAFGIERAATLEIATPWSKDAITVACFGDASANHSTTVGALNAVSYSTFCGSPLPLLLVCEDNGLGISVPTPRGWLPHMLSSRAPIRYADADGSDLDETYRIAHELATWVRETRRPAILHLRMVRLMGHAGSDAEIAYRSQQEIAADYERDPLLHTAKALVARGVISGAEVVDLYDRTARSVRKVAEELRESPTLSSTAEVMAPLLAQQPEQVQREAVASAPESIRETVFGVKLPER